MPTHLKFVWPKEGYKGGETRGFWGRLNDIITGKGPDIFLQEKRSKIPIKPDEWQNWDSYRNPLAHRDEQANPVSRGQQRYDPYTRRYTEWGVPNDWHGAGTHGFGIQADGNGLPRFTLEETRKMKRLGRGQSMDPCKMGDGWSTEGPKRFRGEYDAFWRHAHRQAENLRVPDRHPYDGVNHSMRMRKQGPSDFLYWVSAGFTPDKLGDWFKSYVKLLELNARTKTTRSTLGDVIADKVQDVRAFDKQADQEDIEVQQTQRFWFMRGNLVLCKG
ncbi:hypothetical protein B2J93_7045 [Marssonina coronariae]|uniref:Uncharacterized protein n=1 Tax=Diplocarpon coronariae TaxID=2795749 RepID=A0A218Z1U3_9HELO|nr:hypothetical protein B2J93_7045 [Marssonina coronariae]